MKHRAAAPSFPAARATATGTMSAMKATTAGVTGPPSRRRPQKATVGESSPTGTASRSSMWRAQLSAVGSGMRSRMRCCRSSGVDGLPPRSPPRPSWCGAESSGGLTVGMSADDVRAAFPDVEEQPHKYTDGQYLVVRPADGGEGRLVFEVDADGRITEWRIGLEPQVHYVEGCS